MIYMRALPAIVVTFFISTPALPQANVTNLPEPITPPSTTTIPDHIRAVAIANAPDDAFKVRRRHMEGNYPRTDRHGEHSPDISS